MKKVSIISAEEAALKVQDGDTIATGGFVSCACRRPCPRRWKSASWKPATPRT